MQYSVFALLVTLALSVFTFIPIIAVTDISTQEDAINVIDNPVAVAVNPTTNRVYVDNWGVTRAGLPNTTISVIDGFTNKVTDTIKIGELPYPVVVVNPKTNKIYVSAAPEHTPTPYNLIIIDGSTDRIIDTLPVSGALAVNTDTNIVYLAQTTSYPHGRFHVIDGSTDKILTSFDLDLPNLPSWVTVDPNANKIYVALGNSLAVIDGSTNKVLTSNVTSMCPPEMNPWGCYETALVVNPNANKLYVSSISRGPPFEGMPPPESGSLNASFYIIDGSTYKEIANFTLPYPTGIAVNPKTERVYVTSAYQNKITVIDGSTDSIIDTIKVSGSHQPWGIAVNPNTNTIYVSNRLSDSVTVIDGATNKVIPEFPLLVMIIFAVAISAVLVTRIIPKQLMR